MRRYLLALMVMVSLLGLTLATSCLVRTHPDRGRHGHSVKHSKHGKHSKHKKPKKPKKHKKHRKH